MPDYYGSTTPGQGGGGGTPLYSPARSWYSGNGSYSGGSGMPESPYAGIGKFTTNLLGSSQGQPSPEQAAFERNAPHPLDALGIGPITLGKIPIIGDVLKWGVDRIASAPDVTPLNLLRHGAAFAAWQLNENDPARQAFEQQVKGNYMDAMEAQAQYFRQWWKENSPLPLLDEFVTPAQNLGEGVLKMLGSGPINMPFVAAQRTLSGGILGRSRLATLEVATNEQLQNNTELIRIRDDLKAGKIDDDDALDDLSRAGFELSNPAGPVESFLMDVFSDPVNVVSLGTAGAARQVLRGTIRLGVELTKELGEDTVRSLSKSFLGRTGREFGLNYGKELAEEAFLNPALSPRVQEAINKMGAGTRFWTGTKTTGSGTKAELERLFVQGWSGPTIVKYGRWAERILDPLTLFGADDAGKASLQIFSRRATEGAIEAIGHGTVRAAQVIVGKVAGREMADAFDEYLGRAVSQTVALIGAEGYTVRALRSQDYNKLDNPTDLAMQAARLYGSDVGRYVRDKVETVIPRIVPREGESMRQAIDMARGDANRQLREMFRLTADQADDILRGQGERFIGMVDYAYFGFQTKTFITARKAAVARSGKGDAITFLGPRQITRPLLKTFREAVKNKQMDVVRQMTRQYDQLYFNLALDVPDSELLRNADELAEGLVDKVPNAIDNLALVPDELAEWARNNPQYKLAYKPKDEWGPIISKRGLVGLNMWVDWVDDATAAVQMGRFKTKLNQALKPIATSTINRRAMHRFIQRMATDHGFDEATSERVFWALRDYADKANTEIRGLEVHDYYNAIEHVKIPKSLRNRVSSRELAEGAIWAFEGELSQVGITQKITGKAKSLTAGHGNAFGLLAHKVYPLVRFKLNPWFQLTELIETPILLAGRGVWPGTSQHVLNAQTQFVRMKLNQYGRGLYKGDMAEYLDLVRGSDEVAARIYSDRGLLGRLVRQYTSVSGVKRSGENSMFRHELGRYMASDLKREAPGQFDAIYEWNRARGIYSTINDGDTAIHILFDAFARTDPEGALKFLDPGGKLGAEKVFGLHAPHMFRPGHLGKRARVETSLVRYLGMGSGWQHTGWKSYRRMLRDPNDTTHTPERLAETMRQAGADEDYIERTIAMVTFPTPKEFYAKLGEIGFPPKEVEAMQAWSEHLARMGGISHEEFLSRTFADVPQTIDRHGVNRGRSLFQRLLSAHEDRGIKVPTMNGPEVKAVRARANEVLPTFTHRTDVPINQLNSLERKSRRWTNSRAARDKNRGGNPLLGQPLALTDDDGNAIVFLNGHHQSGVVTPEEWRVMLEKVLTEDQIREAADWYGDMRRAFIAQYDGDTEGAVRGILGFALTQKNTSPAMGMSHLFAALEKVRRGERLPIDKKFDGLATEELKRLLEDDMMTDSGLAQKLTDFIDSLLGNETRTVGVGGDLSWMPAAIDIWAKRDMGFLDHNIKVAHWKKITGATKVEKVKRTLLKKDGKPITRVNKAGETVDVTTTDVVLTYADGRVQTIRGEQLSQGQPSDLQYDFGVERYNEIAKYLNDQQYLKRQTWTAADVQAMGWFRSKVAFGDDTGTPLDSFFRNHYNVTYEVLPAKGTRNVDLYPGLADDGRVPITAAQAKAITSDVSEVSVHEAARISGVQIIRRYNGTGTWVDEGGVANIVPNVTVEVFATDDGVRRFMAALGTLHQQKRVRATKTVVIKTKPSKTNGMRWAYDWPLPKGISKHEADELHAELIAHDEVVAQGSALVSYDDGTFAVRHVWEPDEDIPFWLEKEMEKAIPAGERLSLTHTGPMYAYSEDGYRRGRYVDATELGETASHGERLKTRLENAESDTLVELDEAMIQDIMARVRQTPWNGVTYNLRRGAPPPAMPPVPGETPVPPGMVRAYHYTSGSEDPRAALASVREQGLRQDRARGSQYGEPNQIWFSAQKPNDSHNYIEVHLYPWEITEGGPGGQYIKWDYSGTEPVARVIPGQETALEEWAQRVMDRGNNFAVGRGDIPPERIVTYSEAWMPEYRYIVENGPSNRREFREKFSAWLEPLPAHRADTTTAEAVKRRYDELEVGEPVGALPKGKPGRGPYLTAQGDTKSISFQNVTEANFREALEEFVRENSEELSKRGRYLGVFRDEDSGRFDFDVNYAVYDEDDAEALQLALGRDGGAYDTFSGNGVYAPTLRPDDVPVREPVVITPERTRVYAHRIEEADYASEISGAGRKGAGTTEGSEWVVGDSDSRVRAATERAYRTHAGYETQAFRAERLADGDERYAQSVDELDDIGGPTTGARLFQRAPIGTRAAIQYHSTVPGIGRRAGRATVYFKPGRTARDTVLHEFSHAFSEHLDDSAKRLYLASYNRRVGRGAQPPAPNGGVARVGRKQQWDEDVHEAFAEDVIEYFRTGEPNEVELKPLYDYYGKFLRASADRMKLDDPTRAVLTQIVGTNKWSGGRGFNAGEQQLIDMAFGTSRRAERTTNNLIYFKSERSWLERSANHPYFGLYPASYMWGKVIPELIEFLAFRPFGLKAPFVALNQVNKMYQSLMTQIEHDPEMRKWMDDNEQYLRTIAMLVPGLPWDIPVNSPLWMRRLIQAMEENYYKESQGLPQCGEGVNGPCYKSLPAMVTEFTGKTIPEVMGYAFGPSAGTEAISDLGAAGVGLASQAVGAGFNAIVPPKNAPSYSQQGTPQPTEPEGEFIPPSERGAPATLEQAVSRGAETALGGQSPEELEAQLTEQFNQ